MSIAVVDGLPSHLRPARLIRPRGPPPGDPALPREYDLYPEPTRRRRRRFDDDDAPPAGTVPPCPRSTVAATPTRRPPAGDRWSTWARGRARAGPDPAWWSPSTPPSTPNSASSRPARRPTSTCSSAPCPAPTGRVLLAAKRYRDRGAPAVPPRRRLPGGPPRAPLPRDAGDGHAAPRSGATCSPAIGRAAEFAALCRLWAGGRRGALSGAAGRDRAAAGVHRRRRRRTAAPRLAQLRPVPDELADLWRQLVDGLVGFARAGLAHGDLSAYNLLVHDGRLVLIDLPQVVDVVGNPHGPSSSPATSQRIGEWFTARGHTCTPDALLDELRAEIGLQ